MIATLKAFASLVVIALVTSASVDAQSADDAFRNGMRVRQDKQWSAVVLLMREAIRADSKESTRKIGGFIVGGKEYLPYFYLGEALFNSGDCSGALGAWEESERQGVVQKQRTEFKVLQDGYGTCEGKGFLPSPKFQPAFQRAEAAVADANAAGHSVSEYAGAHPGAWRPELRERHERARGDALAAQQKLNEARVSRRAADLAEAAAIAGRSAALFRTTRTEMEGVVDSLGKLSKAARAAESALQNADAVEAEIEAVLKPGGVRLPPNLIAERQKARDLLTSARQRIRPAGRAPTSEEVAEGVGLVVQAENALRPVRTHAATLAKAAAERELALASQNADEAYAFTETHVKSIEQVIFADKPPAQDVVQQVAPLLTQAQTDLTRGRRRLDTAKRAGDLNGIRAAAQMAANVRAQLEKAGALLGTDKEPGVPEPIMDGARHYFDGRYAEALRTLTEELARNTPMPLQAHVYVLRAAAGFALSVPPGETSDALRAQARRDADACKGLDADFQPNPAAFGPRFIAFFFANDRATQQ